MLSRGKGNKTKEGTLCRGNQCREKGRKNGVLINKTKYTSDVLLAAVAVDRKGFSGSGRELKREFLKNKKGRIVGGESFCGDG